MTTNAKRRIEMNGTGLKNNDEMRSAIGTFKAELGELNGWDYAALGKLKGWMKDYLVIIQAEINKREKRIEIMNELFSQETVFLIERMKAGRLLSDTDR